jgi:flagellar M-ring protein FliF
MRMAGGRTLSRVQIRGIANLVASGVEGLEPNHVSVVDGDGKVLWGDATETDEATTAQLQKKMEIERHLADKANRMLWKVVGEGKAAVSVNADLTWDQKETTTRTFDPERTAVRSEQRDESTEGESSTESSVTNYEVDETTEYISSKGASLEKLTVSVAVDHRRVGDGQGNVTYEPIPPDELDQLRTMVMNAVGYNETRGDRITVINQRFTEPAPVEPGGGFFSSSLFQMLPSVLGKLAAVVIALMLALAVKKQLSTPAPAYPGAGRMAGGMGASDVVSADGRRGSAEDRLQSIAQGNPENVARVMKSWMSEQDSAR